MTIEQTTDSSRDRIINAALELFAKNGYERTPISAIAKQADVAQGLLYRYFTSKEALLCVIIQARFSEMLQASEIDPFVELPLKIESYLMNLVKSIQENRRYWSFYYGLYGQPILQQLLGAEFAEMQEQIISTLSTFFDPRGLHSDRTEAILLYSIIDGICNKYSLTIEGNYPIEEITESLVSKYS